MSEAQGSTLLLPMTDKYSATSTELTSSAPTQTSSPLRGRAVRASLWAISGLVASRGLRLANNVIMARLLFPEAFGLMALVNIFVQGVQLLTDIGIAPAVIQNRRGEERAFLDTAWTMQILRGFALWAILAAIAWPASRVYGEPILASLIFVVGFSAAISGFESTARFTLNRRLHLGKLTGLEVGAQLVGMPVMIIWAWLWPSVWALVGGTLVMALARTVGSHFLLSGHRDCLAWDPSAAKEVFSFGKWIFVVSAVGFLATEIDRLILGRLVPFEILGVYTIAFMLQRMPDDLISRIGERVIFPAVSSQRDVPRPELRRRILRNRWPFLSGLAALIALLAVFGDWVVLTLYDGRYDEAAWMLQILALGLWPRALTNTMGAVLLAVGAPRYLAYSGTLRMLVLAAAVPIGYATWGMLGVVGVVAASACLDYVVESIGLWRHGLLAIRQDLWLSFLLAGFMILLTGARLMSGVEFGTVPWPRLGVSGS